MSERKMNESIGWWSGGGMVVVSWLPEVAVLRAPSRHAVESPGREREGRGEDGEVAIGRTHLREPLHGA